MCRRRRPIHQLRKLRTAIGTRPVIAAASTHPGEESETDRGTPKAQDTLPGLLTILVPRHPDRGPASSRLRAAAASTRATFAGELPDRETEIYVADTLGELGLIYRSRRSYLWAVRW